LKIVCENRLKMSVVETVVEKVAVEKVPKLQVKYERIYMSLFTVLNSFCIPSENDGDFVLKPEDMRKILDAVEFYNDDVAVQSAFIEENIFSKENVKSCRKSMKAERLQWKIDNGLIEKKKRASRAKKVVEKVVEETPVVESAGIPSELPKSKAKAPRVKKDKVAEPVKSVESVVSEPVMEPVVTESVVVEDVPKKKVAVRKPKKKTELAEDKPLN
jgi:hypothetical protein